MKPAQLKYPKIINLMEWVSKFTPLKNLRKASKLSQVDIDGEM